MTDTNSTDRFDLADFLAGDDLDVLAAAPMVLPDEIPGKPTDLVMVLDDMATGPRIPVELRLWFVDDDGTHHWEPVIEGEILALMPRVVGFDAPQAFSRGHALSFPDGANRPWHTQEWIDRLMANSRHVFTRGYRRGFTPIE